MANLWTTAKRAVRRGTDRWYRPVAVGLTVVLLAVAALELAYGLFGPPQWRQAIGDDLGMYTAATQRLAAGGGWYLDRQMHGPYLVDNGDVLYPPVTALVFAPFIALGVVGLWALCAVILVDLARRWRPAPWTWPLLALCLVWPTTLLKGLAGNPSLLVMVGVAMGLRFGWPGALILLKPSLAPFALIGIRTRGWWITALALAALSLAALPDTLAYPRVILDARSDNGWLYSIWDLPIVLPPLILWLSHLVLRLVPGRPGRPVAAVGAGALPGPAGPTRSAADIDGARPPGP